MAKTKLSNKFLKKVVLYDILDTKNYRYYSKPDIYNCCYKIYRVELNKISTLNPEPELIAYTHNLVTFNRI